MNGYGSQYHFDQSIYIEENGPECKLINPISLLKQIHYSNWILMPVNPRKNLQLLRFAEPCLDQAMRYVFQAGQPHPDYG